MSAIVFNTFQCVYKEINSVIIKEVAILWNVIKCKWVLLEVMQVLLLIRMHFYILQYL